MKWNLNLWELLKASKGIPVADPMAVLWGQQYHKKHGIAEISGIPPLEFTSRGGNLIDYRIYGDTQNAQGCGERTENLFDIESVTNGASLSPDDGSLRTDSAYNTSDFIDVNGSVYYTLSLVSVFTRSYRTVRLAYYDDERNFISSYTPTAFKDGKKVFGILTPANTKYIRFSYIGVSSELEDRDIMFVLGSTAPSVYIPYGYGIPVIVYDIYGNAYLPVIYIGSDPLYDGEYVSFSEQKIYRVVEGALTPVSAELPAIPTFTGWNGLRVYTEIEPSEMYIKYKKG